MSAVKWILADTSEVTLELANVRTQAFQYDRSIFRSPYGTVWHQEGDARRLAEEIEVQVHVIDDANGISDAAIAARNIADAAPNVIAIESPIGEFDVVALLTYVRQPIASGYRLDFRFATDAGYKPVSVTP